MTVPPEGLPALPEPLPRPVVDAHTHLDATLAKSGLAPDDALALAASVGIVGAVQVGCDPTDSAWAAEFAATHPSVVATVALHPNDAARGADHLDEDLAAIEALAQRYARTPEGARGPVRGIGETGLDYFRTPEPERQAVQQRSFVAHIAMAKRYDLTLVIHDREAHEDIADILDAEGWPERVMFHCFSGDAGYARRVLAHDAYLSFPGTVTYKANGYLREALAVAPLERILVETDAPYLTPVPHRGKDNASYLIPHTVACMAEVRSTPVADLCDALFRNAGEAFGGSWV